MKTASDAILRPEQASYLDALHGTSVRALAALAGVETIDGRDPLSRPELCGIILPLGDGVGLAIRI